MSTVHLDIPDLRTIARHTVPRIIEGTICPLVLFLVTLRLFGRWGALLAGLVWVYSAIAARLVLRRHVPGVLVLGAVTMTSRTVIAFATGSIVVYFLQPSLGTILVAAAFLASVPLGHPLAARLASDFCPLPDDVRANDHVRRFFRQVSLLWAFTHSLNAAITIWLLVTQSVGTFVIGKTVVSFTSTAVAIAASALWFRASMARNGILVRLPAWRSRGTA